MPFDDPLQNAAALLVMLGGPEARAILARLQPLEQARLRIAMASLDPHHSALASAVEPPATAVPGMPLAGKDTDAAPNSRLLGVPGNYIQRLLEQAFGHPVDVAAAPEAATATTAFAAGAAEPTPSASAAVHGLERLRQAEISTAVQVLAAEHPQAAAAVLAATGPDYAARVLQLMPPRQRAAITLRLARTGSLRAEAVADLGAAMHQALDAVAERKGRQQGGVSLAARVLERLGRPMDVAVMEHIQQEDPTLAERIVRRRDGGASVMGGASLGGAGT
jgi:flagellar motor switch protein FliG